MKFNFKNEKFQKIKCNTLMNKYTKQIGTEMNSIQNLKKKVQSTLKFQFYELRIY